MAKMTMEQLIGHFRELIATTEQTVDKLVKEGAGAEELARAYLYVRNFYEHVGEVGKALDALTHKMAYETVPAAFEAKGLSTMTLKEGFRVTISGLVRASTKDMQAGIEWMDTHKLVETKKGKQIKQCDYGDPASFSTLAKRTINASTLAAFAKDLMADAIELPEDKFNVHFGSNTSVTKVK